MNYENWKPGLPPGDGFLICKKKVVLITSHVLILWVGHSLQLWWVIFSQEILIPGSLPVLSFLKHWPFLDRTNKMGPPFRQLKFVLFWPLLICISIFKKWIRIYKSIHKNNTFMTNLLACIFQTQFSVSVGVPFSKSMLPPLPLVLPPTP